MSDPTRNVLVTGGAGFIGSHVVDAYLERGDRVWVVDDLSSGSLANVNEKAEFVEMGIQDPALRGLFRDVGFDLVSLHAAQVDVRTSVADPARDASINVLGMLNVVEGARETGTRRIVYVSSGGVVYGEPEEIPTPERAAKLPLSPYGVTKLSGEYYLHYYEVVHGIEYVALRYANVFGPRQDPHGEAGVVAIFCERLQSAEELTIFGDGEQTRDYVYVKDVVVANVLASEMVLKPGPDIDAVAFNVGTGAGTSVNRLADVLESIAENRPGRVYREARAGELRHSTLDVSRFAERGWADRHTLEDGLRETFHFIAHQKIGA
jgi:UDP-glucose 4-epimerase|tara:strand:+ start:1248 stop:2210 length:963 start_codon:yes stop_codon:yes gene_type:complete